MAGFYTRAIAAIAALMILNFHLATGGLVSWDFLLSERPRRRLRPCRPRTGRAPSAAQRDKVGGRFRVPTFAHECARRLPTKAPKARRWAFCQ